MINFVRTMAPVLKAKEGITINAICPGIVETPIIPPEMIAAVSREWYPLLSPPNFNILNEIVSHHPQQSSAAT